VSLVVCTGITPTHEVRRDGKPITIDGHTLSIAAVAAAARFNAQVELTGSSATKQKVKKGRAVIDEKVASGTSIYGVSTGFGGSGE
jgi:phenylalanine ammonia-lyase